MMNYTQQNMQSRLALSFITCAILYTGILYNRVESHKVQSTEKSVFTQKSLNNEDQKNINNALESAIVYTHDIGKWLEDLFDAKNNIPYVEHVKQLKKIMKTIKQNFVIPLTPDENTHQTIITMHHLALLLLQRVENTYAVLKSYRGSNYPFVHIGLGMALQKVLNSSRYQAEFDAVLKELHVQLEPSTPALSIKLKELEEAIKLYGERINNKSWRTLTNGLSHRLGCKEQKQ